MEGLSPSPNYSRWFLEIKGKLAGPFALMDIAELHIEGELPGSVVAVAEDNPADRILVIELSKRFVKSEKPTNLAEAIAVQKGLSVQAARKPVAAAPPANPPPPAARATESQQKFSQASAESLIPSRPNEVGMGTAPLTEASPDAEMNLLEALLASKEKNRQVRTFDSSIQRMEERQSYQGNREGFLSGLKLTVASLGALALFSLWGLYTLVHTPTEPAAHPEIGAKNSAAAPKDSAPAQAQMGAPIKPALPSAPLPAKPASKLAELIKSRELEKKRAAENEAQRSSASVSEDRDTTEDQDAERNLETRDRPAASPGKKGRHRPNHSRHASAPGVEEPNLAESGEPSPENGTGNSENPVEGEPPAEEPPGPDVY